MSGKPNLRRRSRQSNAIQVNSATALSTAANASSSAPNGLFGPSESPSSRRDIRKGSALQRNMTLLLRFALRNGSRTVMDGWTVQIPCRSRARVSNRQMPCLRKVQGFNIPWIDQETLSPVFGFSLRNAVCVLRVVRARGRLGRIATLAPSLSFSLGRRDVGLTEGVASHRTLPCIGTYSTLYTVCSMRHHGAQPMPSCGFARRR